MGIKPPPQEKDKSKEEKIEMIINKGGRVAEESLVQQEKDKWTLISVRLPASLLNEIDEKLDKRIGLSRNAWILEAFQEKLKD